MSDRMARRLTHWMRRLPLVGAVTYCFWYLVLTEGDPRDGMVFSFLNDYERPSLWHTWQQVAYSGGPYDGIYPGRAPRNRAEADAVHIAATTITSEDWTSMSAGSTPL